MIFNRVLLRTIVFNRKRPILSRLPYQLAEIEMGVGVSSLVEGPCEAAALRARTNNHSTAVPIAVQEVQYKSWLSQSIHCHLLRSDTLGLVNR